MVKTDEADEAVETHEADAAVRRDRSRRKGFVSEVSDSSVISGRS